MCRKISLVLIAFLFFAAGAAAQKKSTGKKNKPAVKLTAADAAEVPYILADRYFVSNKFDQSKLPNPKIASREQFSAIFHGAPVMGENGTPTHIDFAKQFVIAIVPGLTTRKQDLKVISLKKEGARLMLTYSLTEGEDHPSWTAQYCLIVVVDKKYDGDVVAVRQDAKQ